MANKITYSEEPEKAEKLEVGQWWRNKNGDLYTLTRIGNDYALIRLNGGGNFAQNFHSLSPSIDDVFSTYRGNFTRVTQPFTVTPEP